MKCISLQAPWGYLMVHGDKVEHAKDVENRHWSSKFTGRIVIHQSKSWDDEAMECIFEIDKDAWVFLMDNFMAAHAYGLVGELTFAKQVTVSKSKWFFGDFAWPASEPLAYPHVTPYHGRLGIFDIPDEVVQAARGKRKEETG